MPGHWSRSENEAIVADYFDMLAKEIAGVPFNKADHRRGLSKVLNDRSKGSIELKHQNISAICIEIGVPYVDGYKPRSNYQEDLRQVVLARVTTHQDLLDSLEADVNDPVTSPSVDDILALLEKPPKRLDVPVGRASGVELERSAARRQIDYVGREALNHQLGRAGEELVVAYEQARLIRLGQDGLAGQVEHTAATKGDGLGFDVLSFDKSGRERLIEVKTTRYAKETPFFVTRNEVRVSERHRDQYHVYRVFGFRQSPRLFTLAGAISESFRLDPTVYVARI